MRRFLAVALTLLSACAKPPGPDHIFHGGPILTVDGGGRVVEAMAIRGNVITAVGSDAEVMATKVEHTDVHDLGGRTLMPGLIDAHIHAYGVDADLGRLDLLPRSLQALRAAERLKDSLKRGFTTVRDAGGADWGLKIAVDTGLIPGPRLFHPGRAYLASQAVPPAQQADWRINAWFDATEAYPRQLHEMDKATYVALKRGEIARLGQAIE